MIQWILDAIVVSFLLAGAAFLLEWTLRRHRLPTRWPWMAVLVLSVLLPTLGPQLTGMIAPLRSIAGEQILDLSFPLLLPAVPEASPGVPWVLVGWILLSATLLALGFRTMLHLGAQAKAWSPERVAGVGVYRSSDLGPAVVGIRPSRIVLPTWAMSLDRHRRRLIVLHEGEHARSGDVLLLYLGWGALILMPWNPVLWWCIRRLRLALEVDCDQRVLGAGIPVRSYAEMLLELPRVRRGRALAAVAFAAPQSDLGRRLETMTRPHQSRRPLLAAGAGVVAAALFLFACDSSIPDAPTAPALGQKESGELSFQAEAKFKAAEETAEVRRMKLTAMAKAAYGISIKGSTSELRKSGSVSPMVIVDGEVMDGKKSLASLRPDQIESVEVTKGPAAVAEYGAAARGGVIHITKKH